MNEQEYKKAIKDRLLGITFPCYLIAYGPARDFRTTYRREHGGAFGSRMINTIEQAVDLIDNLNYEGCLSEMSLTYITIEEEGLRETDA